MSISDLFDSGGPELKSRRVLLRHPKRSDYKAWSSLRRESRAFLEPWEPRWTSDESERSSWRDRLRQYALDRRRGTGLSFLIFEQPDQKLAGGISIGNIRRGVAQSGHIGYWMGEKYAGRGLMGEALCLILEHGFGSLGLHRLEAACIPNNQRSIRVLEKAGFSSEGMCRSYLRINGEWQDHVLFSLIDEDYRKNKVRG